MNLTEATKSILITTKQRLENDIETFQLFVNARTDDGKTPLHYASFRGNIEIIQLLISHYGDSSVITDLGMNMIHFACQGNQPSSLVYFKIKEMLSLQLGDKNANTPLHIAVKNGSEQALIFLLQWNINPNIQNNEGKTPLHSAVINHKVRIVKKLLQNGANKNIKDYANKTPVQYAKDYQDVTKIFKELNICQILFYKPPIVKNKYNGVKSVFFILIHLFVSIFTFIVILPCIFLIIIFSI